MKRLIFALAALTVLGPAPRAFSDPPELKRDIMPILEAKCLRCHGDRRKDAKLDLRTREAMLKGGVTGAAIEPGKSAKSLLVELIHFNEMPPKREKPRVTPDELKKIKEWIDAGAKP